MVQQMQLVKEAEDDGIALNGASETAFISGRVLL
jgi:hypothetical protein